MSRSVEKWASKQAQTLSKKVARSKYLFAILATSLIIVNLITIILASLAIDFLLKFHRSHPAEDETIQLVLTSLSAASVIILFLTSFAISAFRTFRRVKFYKLGMHSIELEYVKFQKNHPDYQGTDGEAKLLANVEKIKDDSLSQRRKHSSGLVLRILVGGDDA